VGNCQAQNHQNETTEIAQAMAQAFGNGM